MWIAPNAMPSCSQLAHYFDSFAYDNLEKAAPYILGAGLFALLELSFCNKLKQDNGCSAFQSGIRYCCEKAAPYVLGSAVGAIGRITIGLACYDSKDNRLIGIQYNL